jgi:glycosyltransferase involved in cell wall biosynthesis
MRNVVEWRKAWSSIAALQPDLIVAVNPSILPTCVMGRALGYYGARIACVFHTTVLAGAKLRLTFPISRVALRYSDCLVYVCNAQRDYWQARGLRAVRSVVIHNGVDVSRFSTDEVGENREAIRSRLGFSATDYVLGLTAMFRPEKNHIQAIDALARLRENGASAKLLLVGDGDMRSVVAARVEALGLKEHVVFAGAQNDVRPFLKATDVGVLCSTQGETFSLAALEAMAMNIPMILPRMSGCVELVCGDRGGRLFEVGNTHHLVACLQELRDPAVRGQAAAEARCVAERFTETAMAAKYASLFEDLSGDEKGKTRCDGLAACQP